MKNTSVLFCYGDPNREAGVIGVALAGVSRVTWGQSSAAWQTGRFELLGSSWGGA